MRSRTYFLVAMGAFAFALFAVPASAGDLNPPGVPAPTMKTLDQIPPTWDQILPSNDGGSDGCNSTRFKCVMGGAAVLDKETGLVWERSPDPTAKTWADAVGYCLVRSTGGRLGWRLPTIEELAILVDPTVPYPGPTLFAGHPFTNLQSYYWSITTHAAFESKAHFVWFQHGWVGEDDKGATKNFWCVRGGRGHDGH